MDECLYLRFDILAVISRQLVAVDLNEPPSHLTERQPFGMRTCALRPASARRIGAEQRRQRTVPRHRDWPRAHLHASRVVAKSHSWVEKRTGITWGEIDDLVAERLHPKVVRWKALHYGGLHTRAGTCQAKQSGFVQWLRAMQWGRLVVCIARYWPNCTPTRVIPALARPGGERGHRRLSFKPIHR